MLTIEQYILNMKKKNKLDEFNFKKHAENMAAVIGYVTDYFNNYLDPEAYDYERIKTEEIILKLEQELKSSYPKSKDFIINYYKENKTRIDRTLKKYLESLDYIDLFYCDEDYEIAIDEFCSSIKMRNTGVEKYKVNLRILASEIKDEITEKISVSHFKYLDSALVKWIKETYREYGVNLYDFAQDLTWEYCEKYCEYKNLGRMYGGVHINNYNHRYNDDPFCIDDIYQSNIDRPFIKGKKGELEMILMYEWVFNTVYDTEYWPEYVNLCVAMGRVSIVNGTNKLIPVINDGVEFPPDIEAKMVYIETKDGLLKSSPNGNYVLRLTYKDVNDVIWREQQSIIQVIENLNKTFKIYGAPHTLEIMSPLRTDYLKEEEFFVRYNQFEKSMKKYSSMKLALINGANNSSKRPNYLMQSVEDIITISKIIKELRLKLGLVIDINKLIGRKNSKYDLDEIFNKLAAVRNSIIGVHFSCASISTYVHQIKYEGDKSFLNKFEYPTNSDLLACLSILLSDNQCRYFVPEKLDNSLELEELVDNLLRGGFSFECKEA